MAERSDVNTGPKFFNNAMCQSVLLLLYLRNLSTITILIKYL